jgi:hypothetical protein
MKSKILVKKIWIFFQTAVLDIGLKVAAWRGSHLANSGIKQDVILLSDRFCYKLSFFNNLNKNWLRWKPTATQVYSANHPKISQIAIIKFIYNY